MSKQYFSCAETAKLIRQALKEAFPGVKFSIRSSVYSGGASIRINYVDGPTSDQVKAIAGKFEGSYFCGMTDYKGLNYGSFDGQEVRFGADFVFVNRSLSLALLEGVALKVAKDYGVTQPIEIAFSEFSGAYIKTQNFAVERAAGQPFDRLVYETVSKISLADTKPSPTADRVGFLGDDGYGYGCVGRLEQTQEVAA